MTEQRHQDRVVVVTGGASGIGRGIALAFAAEGATIVVADLQREPKSAERYDEGTDVPVDVQVREQFDRPGWFVETNVADVEDVRRLIDHTVERFDGIDILVNNAGIHIPGTTQELSVRDWRRVIGVNLDGTFYCAKFALPHLKRASGAIINISSVNASEGGSGPSYAASKAAILNLTRDLAVEVGRDGVNVNAICPGFVKTPLQDYLTDEDVEQSRQRTLLPRLGEPTDIGEVATFLASDAGSYIHGASIVVDGGWSAHRGPFTDDNGES